MILRTKNGNHQACDTSVLLEYLGVKKDVSGVQKILSDVQLIACVPIQVAGSREQVTKSDEQVSGLVAGNNDNCFSWTLSTFDLDRTGERIDPAGWDFKRYMENPVVEWSHRYDIPAIGKIEGLVADTTGLHGVLVFNDKEYDPFGWSIGQRVKAGVIRAGSVGFRVLEIEIPDRETARDGTDLIFRKQELLEFSICNVPANPFALVNEKRKMKNEKCNFAAHYWGGLINNF